MRETPLSQDQEFINYLLLLRYGTTTDIKEGFVMLNLKSIATLTKLSSSTIHRLLKIGVKASASGKLVTKKKKTKVSPEHIEYLLNE